jgi:hypothetical protein
MNQTLTKASQLERLQFTSAGGLSIACVKWNGHHPVRGVVVAMKRSTK